MKLRNPFSRRPYSSPGRDLALIGVRQRRERVQATTDDLRARLGLPAWEWKR